MSKIPEFDHETAWEQLARPAFLALPDDVRSLVRSVSEVAGDLAQDASLDMPWPDNAAFRACFGDFTTLTLAQAARATYAFGHWVSARTEEWVELFKCGGHWKFANYCDQIISERLGIARDRRSGAFVVRKGFLVVTVSAGEDSSSLEMGYATLELLEDVRALLAKRAPPPPTAQRSAASGDYVAKTSAALRLLRDRLHDANPPAFDFIHTDAFLVDGGTLSKREDERRKAARLAAVRKTDVVALQDALVNGMRAITRSFVHLGKGEADAARIIDHWFLYLDLPDEVRAEAEAKMKGNAP